MTAKKKKKKENRNVSIKINKKKSSVDEIFKKISQLEFTQESKNGKRLDPISTPVCLTYKAYKRMIGYALRYANEHLRPKKWKEVYGVLIGAVKQNRFVEIKDAIPMCVGKRSGVEFENIHYVDLSQIDASVYEKAIENKDTDFIVGWWHTHPGFGFFFSEVDRETQLGYQDLNPFAVGLIFDHCEKPPGVAALRLKTPQMGISSTYIIVRLYFDQDEKSINQKIKKLIGKIYKNMEKVVKEINYIRDILIKKVLKQLQKNYGLLLIPKESDLIVEKEYERNKGKFYTLDSEFIENSYKIPKFREKIESEIKKSKEFLNNLKNQNQINALKSQRKEFSLKVKTMLEDPNRLYNQIMNDFTKKIKIIYPFFDYLDTDERKIIEYLEERIDDYFNILNKLNEAAELNFEI